MSTRGTTKIPVRLLMLSVLVLSACRAEKPAEPAPQPAATGANAASTAPPTPAVPTPSRSKEQAMAALMALPELKAWAARIEKTSGGTARAALVEDGNAPRTIDGKHYWQFSFVENHSDAMHRWESFLVAQHSDDILVEDFATDSTLTLEQWRRERRPMERAAAPDAF